MNHILDLNTNKSELYGLFQKMSERNTILFLGAGASLNSDRGFLGSTLIDFFEDKKHIKLGINDLKLFVDVIESDAKYSREEFDEYVDSCIRTVKVTEAHKILASIPWRQIITTNMDLLVEQAYQMVEGTALECLKLKPIKGKKELIYQCANDEVRYIKLNGCISSKKEFPLIFSSSDFKNTLPYYKTVLNELKNPSDKLRLLSIGYSFTDPWAKYLFDVIESTNFRENRFFYHIDPYANDSLLNYYESKGICIIKSKFEDFLDTYKKWEEENNKNYVKSKQISFSTSSDSEIQLNNKILLRLNQNIEQLNSKSKIRGISKKEFYIGEEPKFDVIIRNYDVIKEDKLREVRNEFFTYAKNGKSKILPLIFLTGSFGTGKSTFSYRLISNILSDSDGKKVVAFEVLDSTKLNINDLTELFNSCRSDFIILYFNSIEIDYIFKSLLEFRNVLSQQQYNNFSIIFLTSIRENILTRSQLDKNIANSKIINIDTALNETECEKLVHNLKECGLLNYRDKKEEGQIVKKIQKQYRGDSFIALMELVSNNHHVDDLLEAYNQLGDTAKSAFLYTSLLYQFSLKMPSSLLCSLISRNYDEFRKNVVEVEGKGILFQETVSANSTDPDLFFKTKHPLISKKLINVILKPEERYKYLQSIITHLVASNSTSLLVTNLLKALRINEELSQIQVNRLYDLANENFSENSYFLLHYAINLQYRGNFHDLEKALSSVVYASSLVPYRDHRLVHRRAVICFELAKHWYSKESSELVKTIRYLDEAIELFEIKRAFDPCSSYSYVDYLKLKMWILEKINLSDEEILTTRIKIEDLFSIAERVVSDYMSKVLSVLNDYKQKYLFQDDEKEYLRYLDETYDNPDLRPYALILLFNYYMHADKIDKCAEYVEELEYYTDIEDVVRLLFFYYGRHLNFINYRIKFFELFKEYPEYETKEPLRCNYFSYIAESYNKNFSGAYENCHKIDDRFNFVNPDFQLPWKETDNDTIETFIGTFKINRRGFKMVRISSLSQEFPLVSKKNNYIVGKQYYINLYFYLKGIKADVIGEVSVEENT